MRSCKLLDLVVLLLILATTYGRDLRNETCDYPYRAGCKESRQPRTLPPVSPVTTVPPVTQVPNRCPPGPVPECPFPDLDFFVFFPHPNDCHWYFYCNNGIAYCHECRADLHWNVWIDTCDFPYRAGCNESGQPPTLTTVSPVPTLPPVTKDPNPICPASPVPECPFPDGVNATFFPHPNDCHWFFHCRDGVADCYECPADLHWNVVLDTCDYPYRAGCNESGQPPTLTTVSPVPTLPPVTKDPNPICPASPFPECPFPDGVNATFFPHPNDCHWFFHCRDGVADCYECPADLHWNVQLETCDYPYRAGCDL